MGAKPKTASWWNRNKVVVLVAVVGVLVVLLLSFLYYQSQRPNYRDLEKAFNSLQIPSDWKLENYSTPGRVWGGVFCISPDIECPIISSTFKVKQSKLNDLEAQIIATFPSKPEKKCGKSEDNPDITYCTYFLIKNNIKTSVSLSHIGDRLNSQIISVYVE